VNHERDRERISFNHPCMLSTVIHNEVIMLDISPLSLQLFHVLREEILFGRLQPGQKISIEELAQRFGVSTTPVRDAVRQLETAGFVIVSPRKSVTVACLDEKDIKDVFNLRIALECCAVDLSIDRIPPGVIEHALQANQTALDEYNATGNAEYLQKLDDFHQILLDYCDNQKLVAIMEDLRGLIIWARGAPIGQPKSYDVAVREHMEILNFLKLKQQQPAVQAMRTHLTNSCERTLIYWKENSRQA
jgi:DNA-binding GntR family transcriptional regulator